jgi:hypothetical protein
VIRLSVGRTEGPPIGIGRRAVQEKGKNESQSVGDSKDDGGNEGPDPVLGAETIDQPTIEEQNGYFDGTAGDEKGQFCDPDDLGNVFVLAGRYVPHVSVDIVDLCAEDCCDRYGRGSYPGAKEEQLIRSSSVVACEIISV